MEPEVRIYLGKNLDAAWTTTENFLTPELDERLEKFQDTTMRRFGIPISYPTIRKSEWDPRIPNNAFRIEILNQNEEDPLAGPIRVGKDDALDRLSAALAFRTEFYRIHFLSAESVNALLQNTNPALRSWLEERYSLTDLKLLLRALVNPSEEEIAARQSASAAGTNDQPIMVPPENSIRQPAWLLGSLVFWAQVEDPRSFSAMADDLRKPPRARIDPGPVNYQNPEIASLIATGIDSLGQGRVAEAEVAFAGAIKSDKDAAVSSFLILYPQEVRQSLLRKFTDSRTDLWSLSASRVERIELENLLAEKDFDENTDAHTARRLRLCLLAISPKNYRQLQRDLVTKILRQHGKPEDWPAGEAAWFGTKLLTSFNPLVDEMSIPQSGLAFLQNALPQLSADQALEVNRAVMAVCFAPGPNQWCLDLLPTLAGVRRDPEIKFNLAYALAEGEVPAEVSRALTLTDQAKQELISSTLSKEERERLADRLDFVRAVALLRLVELGSDADAREAETTLLRLVNSPNLRGLAPIGGDLVYVKLAILQRIQNRLEEATATLEAGMKKFPDSEELYAAQLWILLKAGDQKGVSQLALESLKKVKKGEKQKITQDSQGFAYVAALGLLLTQSGAWESVAREFLQTDHPYVPYVAMMLYARLTGKDQVEAREVIERRWVRARPESWSARLRQGDQTVWREMLIGYYLGKVQRGQIFGDLEDEQRFNHSDLRHVPMTRRGMLCEAYFYDALLADANEDKDLMHSSLEKTLQTNCPGYFEYTMAQFLLSQPMKQK